MSTTTAPQVFTTQDTIIAWANFAALLATSAVFTIYYVKSVKPAELEKSIGIEAYERCKWYRLVSGFFMSVAAIQYIVFWYYPLPGLPPNLVEFPWQYHVSFYIAVMLTVPFSYLMWVGMRDAGEETMTPKKDHELYSGGIYEHMRHPQAVGEFPLWFTFALLGHSPFLTLFSLLYLPIWYYFSVEEEKDLVLRYGRSYQEYCCRVGWFPNILMVGKNLMVGKDGNHYKRRDGRHMA